MAKKGSDRRLVVMSQVKDLISCNDGRTSGELEEALNTAIHDLVLKALARAKSNDRTTVRAGDL